ncbi:TolC family protein [Alkalilacustris brevis]|uniref:TolC family protein n=1 Tax=Alkalilacustris brevis TaxID=2026338 RepID=UPI001EE47562|nr:TolC family protein [Alkalilacustris brevis]
MTLEMLGLRRYRMGLIPAAALALTGCVGTPIAITEMSAALSAELATASADAEVPVSLAAGFKTAVARAVQTNAGYRATLASEREAASRVGVAESVRKPQLSADASLGGIREFGADRSTNNGISGGISLSQLVYDGGESVAAINRATAEALGAQAERAARANDLALDIARAWIDAWQYGERLRLLRARTEEMNTLVGQIERMATNGMLDRAARDSARRQIVDIQLEETRLQSDMADAQVRFRRYFRQAPGRLSRPDDVITPAAARALSRNWQGAPSLEARAASVISARHSVQEAEAAFSPRLRLQTGLRTPLESGDPTSGTLGLGIDYSLLDGGRRAHQLEAAIARRAASEEQLREAQTTLEAELEAALVRLSGITRSMPLVAEQILLSESEAGTARSQIATGQSSLRQLVEAEIQNYRARDRQVAMQAERQILLLTIAALTGALAEIIGLGTDQNAGAHD